MEPRTHTDDAELLMALGHRAAGHRAFHDGTPYDALTLDGVNAEITTASLRVEALNTWQAGWKAAYAADCAARGVAYVSPKHQPSLKEAS